MDIQSRIQQALDVFDERKNAFLEYWRENANRRTLGILISAGLLFGLLYVSMILPPNDFPVGELVTVPEGATLSEASELLQEQGAVRSPLALRLFVTVWGRQHEVHAGDYLFKQPRTVFGIARALVYGAYGLEPMRIRIPEGVTVRTMATIYASQLPRFNAENFVAQALPMEGYLFPDTYFFLPNTTEDAVLRAMRQNFDDRTVEVVAQAEESGRAFEDVVTMASMLEREARIFEDRRKIAGVLWNRLDKGMPLQVDAVFLYTLGRTTFELTVADLTNEDDPYNTYVHKGLPPSPIGSPSLASLEAAADPIESDNLFYLADNHGVTHYSKTYQEHLRKKRLYLGS